jgi:predicted nucleic acid-binding protein
MTIADLDRALGTIERAMLDSSTLMAYHAPHERTHPLARHLIGRISDDDGPLHGYVSVISTTELLIRPIRTSHEQFTFMHRFISNLPNVTVLPVDDVVPIQAATLRAMARIALPDAMVIASGLLSNCEAIVSNDDGWRRLASLFPQFRWVYLGDYL